MGRSSIYRPEQRFSWTEGHTADVWIVGEGGNLDQLLGSMLATLYSIVAEEFIVGEPREISIEFREGSADLLLAAVLSEALFHLETHSMLFLDPRFVLREKEGVLIASMTARGCPFEIEMEKRGVEVKAITFHGLEMYIRGDGKWNGRVLVDI